MISSSYGGNRSANIQQQGHDSTIRKVDRNSITTCSNSDRTSFVLLTNWNSSYNGDDNDDGSTRSSFRSGSNNTNDGKNKISPKKKKIITPCSVVHDMYCEYTKRRYEDQVDMFLQLCHSHYHTYNNDRTEKDGDDDTISVSTTTTTTTSKVVYNEMKRILQNNPSIIHGTDRITKNNALQRIVSNPDLAGNLQLIKYIVETSKSVVTPSTQQNQQRQRQRKSTNNNTAVKRYYTVQSSTNGRNGSNQSIFSVIPEESAPPILVQKSYCGEDVLQVACKNYSRTRIPLDVIEYIIECHPMSVLTADIYNQNLPLHTLCTVAATTNTAVPLELFVALIQTYTKSCSIPNFNGDLPLHLAASICCCHNIYTDTKHIVWRKEDNNNDHNNSSIIEIDLLDDLIFEDDDDDDTSVDKINWRFDCNYNNDNNNNDSRSIQSPTRSNDPVYSKCKIPSKYVPEKIRKQQEQNEKDKFQKQLELIQYLVYIYPDALKASNDQGMTPYQIALSTAKQQKILLKQHEYTGDDIIMNRSDHDEDNADGSSSTSIQNNGECYIWDPIIDFLRDPESYKEAISNITAATRSDRKKINTCSKATTDDTTTSTCTAAIQCPKKDIGFVSDVSGREIDDQLRNDQAPWHRTSNESNTNNNNTILSSTNTGGGPCRSNMLDTTTDNNYDTNNNMHGHDHHEDPLTSALQVLEDASESEYITTIADNKNYSIAYYSPTKRKNIIDRSNARVDSITPIYGSPKKDQYRQILAFNEPPSSSSSSSSSCFGGGDEQTTSYRPIVSHRNNTKKINNNNDGKQIINLRNKFSSNLSIDSSVKSIYKSDSSHES